MRGLLTDAGWNFSELFVIETGALRGRAPRDHRHTLDATFWIARTGAPRRDLPEELGNWNSLHRQFRRWRMSGVWDPMLKALAEGGGDATFQIVDSTHIIVLPGQKRDSKSGFCPLAADSRPKFMPGPTLRVFQSRFY